MLPIASHSRILYSVLHQVCFTLKSLNAFGDTRSMYFLEALHHIIILGENTCLKEGLNSGRNLLLIAFLSHFVELQELSEVAFSIAAFKMDCHSLYLSLALSVSLHLARCNQWSTRCGVRWWSDRLKISFDVRLCALVAWPRLRVRVLY